MEPIYICSDFHLGKRLSSHTTTASQKRMQDLVYKRAVSICARAGDSPIINVGDLFDQHSNPEAIILQGVEIASACHVVLQGNHDVMNVEGHVSSLDVVHSALGNDSQYGSPVVRREDVGQFTTVRAGNVLFYCIPHQLSQEDFAEAVRAACERSGQSGPNGPDGRATQPDLPEVLALHCNVSDGYGEEVDPSGSGLYLTTELQKLVAEHFKLTIVGHEHIARAVRPLGRSKGLIQIVGNHFPMGFGELEDRFIWKLDQETLALKAVKVFDQKVETAVIQVHDLLDEDAWTELPVHEETLFIDIVGQQESEAGPAVGRARLRLWREWPQLLAIRNNVEFSGGTQTTNRVAAGESLAQALVRTASAAGFKAQLEQIMQELNLDLELDASVSDGVGQAAAELRTAAKEGGE